jgi:molybdopterin-guanine dinucleotide biosynthesis protein A
MGRDKATLPFHGLPLAEAIAASVREAAGSATFIGHPTLPGIPDLYPGEGPLGGILTALRHTAAEYNLIVACDLPRLSPAVLGRLLDAAEAIPGALALLPHAPGGRPEPLCAVYHAAALPVIERCFAAGVRRITRALEDLPVHHLEITEPLHFQNINTPEDWAEYA